MWKWVQDRGWIRTWFIGAVFSLVAGLLIWGTWWETILTNVMPWTLGYVVSTWFISRGD